jgi:hypothetical protein
VTQKGIKRKALSLKEKLRVIREVESNPTLTRLEVAKRLNYSQMNYGEKGF